MLVSHQVRGKVCVVQPHGDIRVGTTDLAFRDAVRRLMAEGHKYLVIDFTGVEFVDSTGLGDLAGLRAAALKAGGNLKLAGLSERLHSLLVMTRMDLVFEIFPTAEEAASSY